MRKNASLFGINESHRLFGVATMVARALGQLQPKIDGWIKSRFSESAVQFNKQMNVWVIHDLGWARGEIPNLLINTTVAAMRAGGAGCAGSRGKLEQSIREAVLLSCKAFVHQDGERFYLRASNRLPVELQDLGTHGRNDRVWLCEGFGGSWCIETNYCAGEYENTNEGSSRYVAWKLDIRTDGPKLDDVVVEAIFSRVPEAVDAALAELSTWVTAEVNEAERRAARPTYDDDLDPFRVVPDESRDLGWNF